MSVLTFTDTRYLPSYMPYVGPLDPVTFKEAALFTECVGPIDPRWDFTIQKARVANKNSEKLNIFIS